MSQDEYLRAVLATQALAALLLSGSYFGSIWPERGKPAKVVIVGLVGVLIYVFAGQVKAFNYGIPFDAVSFFGSAAYAVLLAGFVWYLRRERHKRKGR